MKLKIKFDAIEQASNEHHYFINKENHEIVFISEHEDNYQEKLESADDNNFISIPERTPQDDFNIMESFMYKMTDFNLAREIENVLSKRKPFRNFKEFINNHPKLREKWFEHRDKEIANETMSWLCENNIGLEDRSFIPKIEIKELTVDEVKLPKEWDTFGPIACMNCNNTEGFITRYFELNVSDENILIHEEINKIMKTKYGIEDYSYIGGGDEDILTYAECLKCRSTEIFEDF